MVDASSFFFTSSSNQNRLLISRQRRRKEGGGGGGGGKRKAAAAVASSITEWQQLWSSDFFFFRFFLFLLFFFPPWTDAGPARTAILFFFVLFCFFLRFFSPQNSVTEIKGKRTWAVVYIGFRNCVREDNTITEKLSICIRNYQSTSIWFGELDVWSLTCWEWHHLRHLILNWLNFWWSNKFHGRFIIGISNSIEELRSLNGSLYLKWR